MFSANFERVRQSSGQGTFVFGAGGFDVDYVTSLGLKFTDKPKAYAAYGHDNEENDKTV